MEELRGELNDPMVTNPVPTASEVLLNHIPAAKEEEKTEQRPSSLGRRMCNLVHGVKRKAIDGLATGDLKFALHVTSSKTAGDSHHQGQPHLPVFYHPHAQSFGFTGDGQGLFPWQLQWGGDHPKWLPRPPCAR